MTRRERHVRIIENHGDNPSTRYEFDRVVNARKLGALNDEAVEALARALTASYKRQQRYNREARASDP